MNAIQARAAVLDQPGTSFRLVQSELFGGSDDAIVEIELCTICGSDLHTIEGRRPMHGPTVFGHEIIGRIVWLPDKPVLAKSAHSGSPREVELKLGDRVTWCLHVGCGECFYCSPTHQRDQLPQKCVQLFKYGHQSVSDSHPCTGGFSTHCQLRHGSNIVVLPNDLEAEVVTPANCATATVVAAFREAGECQGKHVLVLGAGMLGLTAVAYAHSQQAASVIVVDPNEKRAGRAANFGATVVCSNLAEANREIIARSDGRGGDLAFDFAGTPDAVLSAIHFLRIGGQAVLCGSVTPMESISISPEMIVRRMLRISGVHNYHSDDLLDAVSFLSANASNYPFRDLVSKTFPLEEIDAAVQAAKSGESVRVGVRPNKDKTAWRSDLVDKP